MQPSKFHTRPATSDDIPTLCELLATLYDQVQDFHTDPAKQAKALRLFLEVPYATVLVVEQGETVAGMCTVTLMISTAEGGYSGELDDLAVAPSFRRKGVARMLISEAEAWSRQHGAVRMRLNCDDENRAAMTLYRSLGWVRSHCFVMFRLFC